MKDVRKRIDGRSHGGSVSMQAEDGEDMWHVFNLLRVGDRVKASTVRRVQTESTTGSVSSSRIKMTLTIEVRKIDFDHEAEAIHVAGVNVEENKWVRNGAHHTLDLVIDRPFTIVKDDGGWDVIAMERLREACDPASRSDLAAVVMQEGLAHVCLITPSTTLVRAKIELSVPRKRRGAHEQAHERGLGRFFAQVLQAIKMHVDFGKIKAILVASPGFVKDQFMKFVKQEVASNKPEMKVIGDNLGKFVTAHSSSGFKHALKEVLQSEEMLARLADTKAAQEVAALERFYSVLHEDPDRAFYGLKLVAAAVERAAVDTLLLSDSLFRAKDPKVRAQYVQVVEDARENGAGVHVFSSLHVSGEQLDQITGIAAILRYALPDLEESDASESESESDSSSESFGDFEEGDDNGASASASGRRGNPKESPAKPKPLPKAQAKAAARRAAASAKPAQESSDDSSEEDRYDPLDDLADDMGF